MSESINPKVVIEIYGVNITITADRPVDVVVLDNDLKDVPTGMITVEGIQTPYYRGNVEYGDEESDKFVRTVYKEVEEMESQKGVSSV